MPDPNVLYIVTAIVVLALVGWVAVVLMRPADRGPKAAAQSTMKPSDAVDIEKPEAPKLG